MAFLSLQGQLPLDEIYSQEGSIALILTKTFPTFSALPSEWYSLWGLQNVP